MDPGPLTRSRKVRPETHLIDLIELKYVNVPRRIRRILVALVVRHKASLILRPFLDPWVRMASPFREVLVVEVLETSVRVVVPRKIEIVPLFAHKLTKVMAKF